MNDERARLLETGCLLLARYIHQVVANVLNYLIIQGDDLGIITSGMSNRG